MLLHELNLSVGLNVEHEQVGILVVADIRQLGTTKGRDDWRNRIAVSNDKNLASAVTQHRDRGFNLE